MLRNIFMSNPVKLWVFSLCCNLITFPVCLSVQLPGDLNKMHLTDHAHQQVMHVPPSQSGCSIASDSGSSSLSDIYQVSATLHQKHASKHFLDKILTFALWRQPT